MNNTSDSSSSSNVDWGEKSWQFKYLCTQWHQAKIVQSNWLFETVCLSLYFHSPHFCHHRNTLHMWTHFFIEVFSRVSSSSSCRFLTVCYFGLSRFCSMLWIFVWCHATIAKQIRFIGFDGALTCTTSIHYVCMRFSSSHMFCVCVYVFVVE